MRAATTVVVHPGQSERLSKGEEARAARTRRKKKKLENVQTCDSSNTHKGHRKKKRENALFPKKKKKLGHQ